MKHLLPVYLPLLFIPFYSLHAQQEYALRYGVKGGCNLSNTTTGIGTGSSYAAPKPKWGASAGIFVNLPISYRFSIQPELIYSSEGSRQSGLAPNANSSSFTQLYVMKLQYLHFPVLLQLVDEESGLYIEAGPQVSWLTSGKCFSAITMTEINPSLNFKSYFNSCYMTGSIGGGITFYNGIGIGARYNIGLTKATEDLGNMKINSGYVGLHVKF